MVFQRQSFLDTFIFAYFFSVEKEMYLNISWGHSLLRLLTGVPKKVEESTYSKQL